MNTRFTDFYMDIALRTARMSRAVRLQVGAIIVKDSRIVSIGFNGTPTGWDNNCEDKEYMSGDAGSWLNPSEIYEQWPFEETVPVTNNNESFEIPRRYRLKTKPEVLHAESNALMKLARSTESGDNATLFVTHAPCINCAKLVYQGGINSVYYRNTYRETDGIDFLIKSGVKIEKC